METKKQINLEDNGVICITQHSNAFIRKLLSSIETNQSHEYRNYEDPRQLLQLTGFICVLHKLGILLDGKLMKNVIEALSRYQRVPLTHGVVWSPLTFLSKHAKTLVKSQDKQADFHRQYQTSLEKLNQNDLRTCRQLGTQITLWCISMQRVFAAGTQGQLKNFAKLSLQGQDYAAQVSNLIDSLMRRHLALTTPMSKAMLFTMCKLLQYLHILQQTFASNQILCTRFLSSVMQWQKQKILHVLQLTKKSIVDLKLMQRKMNILTALKLSEKSIKGCPSKQHLTIINLALSEFLGKDRLLAADKQKLLKSITQRASNLCRLEKKPGWELDSTNLINNYDILSMSDAALKEYVQQQHNPYLLQVRTDSQAAIDSTNNAHFVS